jgi:hypothetical protein
MVDKGGRAARSCGVSVWANEVEPDDEHVPGIYGAGGGGLQFAETGVHVTLTHGRTVATKTSHRRRYYENSVALLGESMVGDGVFEWEFLLSDGPQREGECPFFGFGVCLEGIDVANTYRLFSSDEAWSMDAGEGALRGHGESGEHGAGGFVVGDRLGCVLDLGAGTLSFRKNGGEHGEAVHSGIVGPVRRFVEFCYEEEAVSIMQGPFAG